MGFLATFFRRFALYSLFAVLFVNAVSANAAIVEPSSKTLIILLGGIASESSGLNRDGCISVENTESFGKTGVVQSLKSAVGNANVYYRPYLNPAESPDVLAKEFAEKNRAKVKTNCSLYPVVGSILDDAVEYWFQEQLKLSAGSFETENFLQSWISSWKASTGKTPSLADLKFSRPDLIPSKYVVIAEGMGGLVAREYIQSAFYRGDIENVLFFDTPHEGTGFADQALLGLHSGFKSEKKSVETLTAAIPLVLTAYLIGGSDALQNVLTDLLKSIVLGLAENLNEPLKSSQKNLFDGFSLKDPALWYLTQDADSKDKEYSAAIEASGISKDKLGATQYLNAIGKLSSFEHPNYNVVYSYGMPTIGNGRRTLADFKNQMKNHVSEAVLKKALSDTLMNSSALKNLQSLKELKFNLSSLPGTTRKIFELLEKYIPEEFRSELLSSAMDFYSSNYKGMISELNDIKAKGMSVNAKNLANYGLNFFDQGRLDVPSYSAFGGNVGIFKESSVNRKEYSLENANEKSKDLSKKLKDLGTLESARIIVDAALSAACGALEKSGVGAAYGKICRASEFATNVSLISEISSKASSFAKSAFDLTSAKYYSLRAANDNKNSIAVESHKVSYSDLESMLFVKPHLSFKTVADSSGALVPLLLYKKTSGEVANYKDLERNFGDSVFARYPVSIKNAVKANLKMQSGLESISMKFLQKNGRSDYYTFPSAVLTDFIKEIHFVVDDFMPNEMWLIRFDFNSKAQIVFERDSIDWNMRLNVGKKTYPAIKLEKSPISQDGTLILKLSEILELYESKGVVSLKLSAIEEEGPNLISVYAVNKLGMSANQQFSFYFQSTRPYIQEGWPRSLQYVGNLDSAYIQLSNLGNPYSVTEAKAYLLQGADTLFTSLVKIDTVLETLKDSSWEQKWVLSTSFPQLSKNINLKDGSYTILWNVKTKSQTEAESEMQYALQTRIFLDRTNPRIELKIPNVHLSNSYKDGLWGSVLNLDSSEYYGLSHVKGYIVSSKGTVELFSEENFVGKEFRIGWSENTLNLPQGNAVLHVEAFDYCQNKTEVSQEIWVDSEPPSVIENTVLFIASNILNDTVFVNAESLLKFSFDVKDTMHGRDSTEMLVRFYFEDVDSGFTQEFYRDTVVKDTARIIFEEPEALKIKDGIYKIGVVLQDAAGNMSDKYMFPQILVFDRTPPVIKAFLLSAPVYVSSKNVDGAIAYISQTLDDARNRSNLKCSWKASSENYEGDWNFIGLETQSKFGKDNTAFGINFENLDSLKAGRWLFYVGCYDAVGNFSLNADVVGIGKRYPEIKSPTWLTDFSIDAENVLITGIAPDPIVPNGNEQTAFYKVDWRTKNGKWNSSGVTILQNTVDSYERNLAIWNRSMLPKGVYEIRLTTCNAITDTICVSDIQEIYLDDVQKTEARLKLDVPDSQLAGDLQEIRITIDDSEASDWSIDAKILVQDAKNPSQQKLAKKYFKDKVSPSPFVKSVKEYPEGLSLVQDSIGFWTARWKGVAKSIDSLVKPQIALKGLKKNLSLVQSKLPNKIDSSLSIAAINTGLIKIPAYDIVYYFDVVDPEMEFHFFADSAFIIDASSIENAKIASDDLQLAGSKAIYADPSNYQSSFLWDGLTQTGLYPGKGNATLYVTAVSKTNGKAIYDSVSWQLSLPTVKIISDIQDTGSFVISKGKDSSEIITLGSANFGYEFGVTGQKAKVYAFVKNQLGDTIKTLVNGAEYVAGSSRNAYSVHWDGTSENGFASIEKGVYTIDIEAIDGDGNTSKISYPFKLEYAGSLLPVSDSKTTDSILAPSLRMKEAKIDENGFLRYIGLADYELVSGIESSVLPDSEKVFEYSWIVDPEKSYQTPAFYEANRFSLGIRRQRPEFDVTVAALLMTRGYNIGDWPNYNVKSDAYQFRIQLYKVHFDIRDGGKYVVSSFALNPNTKIVAYGAYGKSSYSIGLAVKVLPSSSYEKIKKLLNERDSFVGSTALKSSWSAVWDDHETEESHLKDWFNNWQGETVYWQSSKVFVHDSSPFYLKGRTSKSSCEPSTSLEDKSNFVCGAPLAKNESAKTINDFNPHSDMLNIHVEYADDKKAFGVGSYTDCNFCGNRGSRTNVVMKLSLVVDSAYWHPKFGYNNLANRYTRFDHSNKTLYGDQGYFAKFPNTDWNFFDGTAKKLDRNYGLVTPFEMQRFKMLKLPENPLIFADELDSKWNSSNFSLKFFGSKGIENFKAVVTADSRIKDLQHSNTVFDFNSKYEVNPESFEVLVAPVTKAIDAIHYDLDKDNRIAYPYLSIEKPVVSGECLSVAIRDVDRCYKYYQGASRLHYALNDWNDSLWINRFLNADSTIKNPISTEFSKVGSRNYESFKPVSGLNAKFTTSKDDQKKKFQYLAKNDVKSAHWTILGKALSSISMPKETFNKGSSKLQLKLFTAQKNWRIATTNGAVDSVWNVGQVQKDSVRFIRLQDSSFVKNIPNKTEIRIENLIPQNPNVPLLQNKYAKTIHFTDPVLLERSKGSLHKYFDVDTLASGMGLVVTKNKLLPLNKRENEMVSLWGNVPGDNVQWNLSYLKNGKILPIAKGIQISQNKEILFAEFNVNMLQGNTSFFLTYGGNNGNLYFKQLDVHIGEFVSSNDTTLVQSMYGNVNVQFKPGSYKSNVDVTARVVGLGDYNSDFADSLESVGPVIEILPSHVFPDDSSKWPRIQVLLSRESLETVDVANLKIYKVDFASNALIPLEQIEKVFLDSSGRPVGNIDDGWESVLVSGLTRTFSTFAVLDTSFANSVHAVKNIVKEKGNLDCKEMQMDSVWMGIANGNLLYPNPCEGKNEYLLQLRSNNNAAAEFQGSADTTISLYVRKSDLPYTEKVFDSRLSVFAIDGGVKQMLGPKVFVDENEPKIENALVRAETIGSSKVLTVSASVYDSESGVASVLLEVYWAGKLLKQQELTNGTEISENIILDKSVLEDCLGCKAMVKIKALDYGRNWSVSSLESEKMYPYPSSLVLWYPLEDGFGSVAREFLGSGLDLALGQVNRPWIHGNSVSLLENTDVAPTNGIRKNPEYKDNAISVEMVLKPYAMNVSGEHSLLTWKGEKNWCIGVAEKNQYFVGYGEKRVLLSTQTILAAETHLTFVMVDNEIRLYENGILSDTKYLSESFEWNLNGYPVLGAQNGISSVKASLSNLRFYEAALSDEEIHTLYSNFFNSDPVMAMARAIDLEYENLKIDQSCGVAGNAFLTQKNRTSHGKMHWSPKLSSGRYYLYALARGYENSQMKFEIFLDDRAVGTFEVPSNGYWNKVQIPNLVLDLMPTSKISIKPLYGTSVAAFALSNKPLSTSEIHFDEQKWQQEAPRVQVEMRYDSFDGIWVKPVFRIKNKTDQNIDGAALRYYYKGEGAKVEGVSFYPGTTMQIGHDAGDVYYSEFKFTESILRNGSAYWENGPQLGLHRTDYALWFQEDDPSYDSLARSYTFVPTESVALLDSNGMLLNSWSCFENEHALQDLEPQVKVMAKDVRLGSAQSSLVSMYVENVGTVPLDSFEVRYYFRDSLPSISLDVYYSPFASYSLQNAGGDLYYVSFVYDNVLLNPGEKTDWNSGVNFEIHYADWNDSFNPLDDPSHSGLALDFAKADSIVVLDKSGDLIYGSVPKPSLENVKAKIEYVDIVRKEGNLLIVNVPVSGVYSLEIVDAIGIPEKVLYQGFWNDGVHSIAVDVERIRKGSYLVLRRNSEILSWNLFK